MKVWSFISFLLFGCSFLTYAGSNDGNSLLVNCKSAVDILDGNSYISEPKGAMSCISYIRGFTDLNSFYRYSRDNKSVDFCVPEGVNAGQNTRVVLKYLRENPSELHAHTAVLVRRALIQAYPCK